LRFQTAGVAGRDPRCRLAGGGRPRPDPVTPPFHAADL